MSEQSYSVKYSCGSSIKIKGQEEGSPCGADLTSTIAKLKSENPVTPGNSVLVEYECPACGAPHTVRFT